MAEQLHDQDVADGDVWLTHFHSQHAFSLAAWPTGAGKSQCLFISFVQLGGAVTHRSGQWDVHKSRLRVFLGNFSPNFMCAAKEFLFFGWLVGYVAICVSLLIMLLTTSVFLLIFSMHRREVLYLSLPSSFVVVLTFTLWKILGFLYLLIFLCSEVECDCI